MAVKDRAELVEALDRAEAALREATADVQRTRETVVAAEEADLTVRELARRSGVGEDAVLAFARTAGELLAEQTCATQATLSADTVRRAALLAVAGVAWEAELGPLLSSGQVRELLGVSRQRVNELLRQHRLIALTDSASRSRFPAFQFGERGPLAVLIGVFWAVAASVNEWTAAAWCVAPDEALDGLSPLEWVRQGRDPQRLDRVARQDAARMAA